MHVDETLYRRRRPKAVREVEQFRADAKKALLYFLIEGHLRAPEAIDGLLRVTNEEQLAGTGRTARQSSRSGHRREQQQDLGLSGSVSWNSSTKKCVNRFCSPSHSIMIANKITRLDEEVQKSRHPTSPSEARSPRSRPAAPHGGAGRDRLRSRR